MKILVISDNDDIVYNIEPEHADLLISCGDLSDKSILKAAHIARCTKIMAIKGNHDANDTFPYPILDLHMTLHRWRNLRFGGFHGCWKYKPDGDFLYEQDEVKAMLRDFPDVDIFVAHNSPRGVHEYPDEVHIGFEAFAEYIERAKPILFLHGHQHIHEVTTIGTTHVVSTFGQRRIEF